MSNKTLFFNDTGNTTSQDTGSNSSFAPLTITLIAAGVLAAHVFACCVVAYHKRKKIQSKASLLS